MMQFSLYLAALGYQFAAATLIKMAIDYVEVGYGLNPWIALPLAVVAGAASLFTVYHSTQLED
jgi:hypothetical protein